MGLLIENALNFSMSRILNAKHSDSGNKKYVRTHTSCLPVLNKTQKLVEFKHSL